jgi:hypothetical protein
MSDNVLRAQIDFFIGKAIEHRRDAERDLTEWCKGMYTGLAAGYEMAAYILAVNSGLAEWARLP